MAEYKNGFNAFGGIPVDSSRLASDVQTGRAVYVDDGEYSEEAGYKNRVDSVVREGYHEEAPFEVPEIVVPTPIIPNGTKNITENGVYDVHEFANADVNVAGGGGGSNWQSTELFNSTNITVEANPQEENGYIATISVPVDFSDGDLVNITMTGDVVLSDLHSVVRSDPSEEFYYIFEKFFNDDSSIEAFYSNSEFRILLHNFETEPAITSLKIEKIYKV